jgi:hypothetical protein
MTLKGMMGFGLLVVVLSVGCAQEMLRVSEADGGCQVPPVVSFEITPPEVTGGADVDLIVSLKLAWDVDFAIALELLGGESYNVRVEVPFRRTSPGNAQGAYGVTLRNPFGAGVVPGTVTARVVSEQGWECFSEFSTTTSFQLK